MSTSRHHHGNRARRHSTRRLSDLDEWPSTLLTPVEHGLVQIHDLADAAAFVFDLFELFGDDFVFGALVLLDDNHQLTGILLDPPTDIADAICVVSGADHGVVCTQAMMVIRRGRLADAPPSPTDLAGYEACRGMCRTAGVRWLDLLLANPRQLQSIGIVCDPDSPWITDTAA